MEVHGMNKILLNWLDNNLIKCKNINYDYDTSHIHGTFIYDTNIYVSNADTTTWLPLVNHSRS